MAKQKSKKEVKPAKKKVKSVLESHPQVEHGARGLFRNENGRTIVQERVPRGDLPQDDVIMPRTEGDLTDDDISIIVKEAKSLIDPMLEKYDGDVAMEDALSKALYSMGGGKYQGRVGANSQKLILDQMKGTKPAPKKTPKEAATKGDLAEEAKRKGLIKTYDTALPQQWVNEFMGKLGDDAFADVLTSSFVWAYDNKSVMGYPYPLTDKASEMLKKHYPRYHDALKAPAAEKQAPDIDTLIESIPITVSDVGGGSRKEKSVSPKEVGMDKEMLRKEANTLSKKLDALKVLLGDEDDGSDEVEACAKVAVEAPETEGAEAPEAVEATEAAEGAEVAETSEVESADASVVGSIDEIAGMVEKEAREKGDLDLFRIAFQLDCVSDYLSGEKDAAVLQSDPDEAFMQKAFHAGAPETDKDEPYMKEFDTDLSKEVAGVVGKTAASLPYAVKKDA